MRRPLPWWLMVCVLLAATLSASARAEIPVPGERLQFPNAYYDYLYDGPDFDPSSSSENSAVFLRNQARLKGVPNWQDLSFSPVIRIISRDSGEPVASYSLPGSSFCEHEDDNCAVDGLFPIVLASSPQEPVLGVISHVGVHGQRLTILRPIVDKAGPVFEATAEYALILRMLPSGAYAELEMADSAGKVHREHRMWLAGGDEGCVDVPEVALQPPQGLSGASAEFDQQLRTIASDRDFEAFVSLLADDVMVSFGGTGGRAEFLAQWSPGGEAGHQRFWDTLDRLLASGGRSLPDNPDSLTYPWFFVDWPQDKDAHDMFIARDGVALRAGPAERAPVLARLPLSAVRYAAPDVTTDTVDWLDGRWIPVAAPGQCLGYVNAGDVAPVLGTRLVARRLADRWAIEAFVAGD